MVGTARNFVSDEDEDDLKSKKDAIEAEFTTRFFQILTIIFSLIFLFSFMTRVFGEESALPVVGRVYPQPPTPNVIGDWWVKDVFPQGWEWIRRQQRTLNPPPKEPSPQIRQAGAGDCPATKPAPPKPPEGGRTEIA